MIFLLSQLDKHVHLKHLHRSELDKACFARDTAYSDTKDLRELF